MVALFAAVVVVWLGVSLACFVLGFLFWAFPIDSENKRFGGRLLLVALVWPVAFLVWLLVNFRSLLADAGWGRTDA